MHVVCHEPVRFVTKTSATPNFYCSYEHMISSEPNINSKSFYIKQNVIGKIKLKNIRY